MQFDKSFDSLSLISHLVEFVVHPHSEVLLLARSDVRLRSFVRLGGKSGCLEPTIAPQQGHAVSWSLSLMLIRTVLNLVVIC